MTARADANRKRWAVRLGFSAAVMAALAFAVVARDAASKEIETVAGSVAPEWSAAFSETAEIRIVSPDTTLTLVRAGEAWTMSDRGGYPVQPSALTTLHRFLSALVFSGARTGDPANHGRLGVTDPLEGGAGTRLTAFDARGEPRLDWIFGQERTDGVFLRRPGEDQTYAAAGDPPDLASPAFWLDLDFLGVERVDIAEVRIVPEGGGEPYRLARGAPAASDFVLLEPAEGYEMITAGAANGPGGAMADLRFFDVRRAGDEGAPAGSHVVRTFDGVETTLTLFREGADAWVSLAARAVDLQNSAAVERAAAFNARTAGWLFKLPLYASDRLIRPLSGIARPVSATPAEP